MGGVANWGSNFLVGVTFPVVEQLIGQYAFALFAAVVIILIVAVVW